MRITLFLITTSYIAVGMLRSIGIYELISTTQSIIILMIVNTFGVLVLANKKLTLTQIFPVLIFIVLMIYTSVTSKFPTASIIFAYYLLASSLLYMLLVRSNSASFAQQNSKLQSRPIIDFAKFALILCAGIHALVSVLFYLFQPVRTSGLMDDFGQAAMLILLAFGLAYPLLKHKPIFTAIALLMFCAIFSAFSRTANALLIFLLLALLLQSKTSIERWFVLKISLTALIAFVFVYSYPMLLGEFVIDRGGLSHFSSLNSRTIYWQTAWEAILHKPLIGHGLGTFAWSGIQEVVPFNVILFVHNDYLQIWHDLGFLWLAAFLSTFAYILLKHSPFKLQFKPILNFSFTIINKQKFISWSLLVIIALYMSMNFLILSIEFQVIIVILLADLKRHKLV